MNEHVLSESKLKNYLLVEGNDDKQVFRHLLNYYQISGWDGIGVLKNRDEYFEIKDFGGIDELLKSLKVFLKKSDSGRYGVVVDADTDLENTWKRLQGILAASNYERVPDLPHSDGTIIMQEGLPTVGIWLMPNNKLPGMMQDFISFLRPSEDVFWPMAEEVVVKVIEKGCHFRPSYKSKACLHTWLAWQEEPGKPMGQAITKRYVNADAIHAKQLISWFRKVFELERA